MKKLLIASILLVLLIPSAINAVVLYGCDGSGSVLVSDPSEC